MDSLIITIFITVCDTIYPTQVKVPYCRELPIVHNYYMVTDTGEYPKTLMMPTKTYPIFLDDFIKN